MLDGPFFHILPGLAVKGYNLSQHYPFNPEAG